MEQHCAIEVTKEKSKFHTASVYGMDKGYEGLQGGVRRGYAEWLKFKELECDSFRAAES